MVLLDKFIAEIVGSQDLQVRALFAQFLLEVVSKGNEEGKLGVLRRSQFLLLGVMKWQGIHVLSRSCVHTNANMFRLTLMVNSKVRELLRWDYDFEIEKFEF